MCIICNAGDAGDDFLTKFAQAQGAMRRATEAMLAASRAAPDPIVKRRYARMHKRMVRMSRDWNRLQQEREVPFEEVRPAALRVDFLTIDGKSVHIIGGISLDEAQRLGHQG